jgi:phosphoribosylamine---glycine ligase
MNILLIGAGGREHALAWALARSPRLTRLFAAPGNPGIAAHATCLPLDVTDHAGMIAACRAHHIELVVVGPEVPLVAGIVDDLTAAGIPAFGPTRAAAALEGSKGFTKDLCRDALIPTAGYQRFSALAPAKAYIRAGRIPVVIKADGLAAGKGVTVAEKLEDALSALDLCFAAPGAEVVVEEFMAGTEASLFVLCDGQTAKILGSAQDHKRAYDGDLGPNTGGMGAFSPAMNLTPELEARAMAEIVLPTLRAMAKRGTPFCGMLYAGLMLTDEGPKLIEYNCRFGDPETQVLLPRLQSDLVALLYASATGTLDKIDIKMSDAFALTIVIAANGYPGAVKHGEPLQGLEAAQVRSGLPIFHAGTAMVEGTLSSKGGRVLNVTALGRTLGEARQNALDAAGLITWPGGFYRRDIGLSWSHSRSGAHAHHD